MPSTVGSKKLSKKFMLLTDSFRFFENLGFEGGQKLRFYSGVGKLHKTYSSLFRATNLSASKMF